MLPDFQSCLLQHGDNIFKHIMSHCPSMFLPCLLAQCILCHKSCRFKAEEREKQPQHCFLPFGLGPRTCIAMRFVQLVAKVTIIELLKRYSFLCSSDTEVIWMQCCLWIWNKKCKLFCRYLCSFKALVLSRDQRMAYISKWLLDHLIPHYSSNSIHYKCISIIATITSNHACLVVNYKL